MKEIRTAVAVGAHPRRRTPIVHIPALPVVAEALAGPSLKCPPVAAAAAPAAAAAKTIPRGAIARDVAANGARAQVELAVISPLHRRAAIPAVSVVPAAASVAVASAAVASAPSSSA